MIPSSTDVVAAVREVVEVNRTAKTPLQANVSYDLVVSILRHEHHYSEEAAHEAIFEAVMSGHVILAMAKYRKSDRNESLCLEMEESQ